MPTQPRPKLPVKGSGEDGHVGSVSEKMRGHSSRYPSLCFLQGNAVPACGFTCAIMPLTAYSRRHCLVQQPRIHRTFLSALYKHNTEELRGDRLSNMHDEHVELQRRLLLCRRAVLAAAEIGGLATELPTIRLHQNSLQPAGQLLRRLITPTALPPPKPPPHPPFHLGAVYRLPPRPLHSFPGPPPDGPYPAQCRPPGFLAGELAH